LETLYQQVGDLKNPEKSALVSLFNQLREAELARIKEVYEGKNPFDQELLQTFHHRGINYIERYVDKFQPFNQAISMKTEMNVNFEIEEGLQFRGKIDRLDIRDDAMIITDYKTNKSLPKDGENTIEEQITLYSIGMKHDYGQQVSKFLGRVVYLHLQKIHEWEITEEKIQDVKARYVALMQEIQQKKADYESGDETSFPPRQNHFCETCPFVQLCPVFKHKYLSSDEKITVAELGEMSVKKLIEKYALTYEKFKRFEGEKDVLKEELVNYAKEKGLKKLYGETKKLSMSEKVTYSPLADQKETLEQKLDEAGVLDEVLNIDSNKLARKFKDGTLEYGEFKECVGKKETLYVSRVSDLKEEEMG
jgi:CRISPR/Cas system-associated exonuclease Cas4 (RecB family)